jgi:putative redox protein
MFTIESTYKGELRTESVHQVSGSTLLTDAPLDNHGRGETFSPTDLLATALGTCMLTVMGIAANRNGINIIQTKIEITKIMNNSPRKVAGVNIIFIMPAILYTDEEKKILENAALTCPVALSLHPDLIQNVKFNYFTNDEK